MGCTGYSQQPLLPRDSLRVRFSEVDIHLYLTLRCPRALSITNPDLPLTEFSQQDPQPEGPRAVAVGQSRGLQQVLRPALLPFFEAVWPLAQKEVVGRKGRLEAQGLCVPGRLSQQELGL